MNRLYEVTDALLLWQTIGCLIGLCVSIVLLQLVRACWSFRSLRWPGLLLSVSLLVWNCGGLVNALLIIAGFDYQSAPAKAACAFGYTGLICVTWAVLSVWGLLIEGQWRKRLHRALQVLAAGLGVVATVWLWMDALHSNAPLSRTGIRILTEANFYVLVAAAMVLALFSHPARTTRVCARLMIFGLLGPMVAAVLIPIYSLLPQAIRVSLSVYAEQSVNYIAVAGFLLLAKLRFTDVLVERALRIFSVIFSGAVLWRALQALLGTLPRDAHMPPALAVAAIVSVTVLALSMPVLDRRIRNLTRQILQQPDFEAELERLAGALPEMHEESQILGCIPNILSALFQPASVAVLPVDAVPETLLTRLTSREILEEHPGSRAFSIRDESADTLVPIPQNGHGVCCVIAIGRHAGRRGFLASELSFLYRFAQMLAARIAAIREEREEREREQREAMLLHQNVEAELRALRAQINPHFLFNALNTIADLIVVDSRQAEQMTERLAELFRHILMRSQNATNTVREEIEFTRRYLEIEETRFRDRLRVRIDADPSTLEMEIPALILQPLVENAIKHGIAPKIEGGAVTISATCDNGFLLLVVEDNGVGTLGTHASVTHMQKASDRDAGNGSRSTGTGLTNIRRRLETLYGARAGLWIDGPGEGGCRAIIRIPS